MRAVPGTLLCLPAVTMSQRSLDVPEQSTSEMGMRFSRKSPAVGSTKRHWPLGARMVTLVRLRVAVVSTALASAAAVGLKEPPRDTGTALSGISMAEMVPVTWEPRSADEGTAAPRAMPPLEAAADEEAPRELVTVMSTVRVRRLEQDAGSVWMAGSEVMLDVAARVEVVAAALEAADVADTADMADAEEEAEEAEEAAVDEDEAGGAAAAEPKIKYCDLSAELQAAMSSTSPLTVMQDPGAFSGSNERGPAVPLKGKSWELVAWPPVRVSGNVQACPECSRRA